MYAKREFLVDLGFTFTYQILAPYCFVIDRLVGERSLWNLSSLEVSRTPKHIRRLWGPILPKEPWLENECD